VAGCVADARFEPVDGLLPSSLGGEQPEDDGLVRRYRCSALLGAQRLRSVLIGSLVLCGAFGLVAVLAAVAALGLRRSVGPFR
jgi:hypothetical protein